MNITTPNNSTAMIAAVFQRYGMHALNIEQLIFSIAEQQCSDYPDIALWEFHYNDKTGFWAPMIDKATVSVACPNYYENANMDRLSFGAAVTFMAINRLVWHLHEKQPHSPIIKELIQKQDALRDFMYADNTTLDTSAIYNFLD